jgi:hypothetical protein
MFTTGGTTEYRALQININVHNACPQNIVKFIVGWNSYYSTNRFTTYDFDVSLS